MKKTYDKLYDDNEVSFAGVLVDGVSYDIVVSNFVIDRRRCPILIDVANPFSKAVGHAFVSTNLNVPVDHALAVAHAYLAKKKWHVRNLLYIEGEHGLTLYETSGIHMEERAVTVQQLTAGYRLSDDVPDGMTPFSEASWDVGANVTLDLVGQSEREVKDIRLDEEGKRQRDVDVAPFGGNHYYNVATRDGFASAIGLSCEVPRELIEPIRMNNELDAVVCYLPELARGHMEHYCLYPGPGTSWDTMFSLAEAICDGWVARALFHVIDEGQHTTVDYRLTRDGLVATKVSQVSFP